MTLFEILVILALAALIVGLIVLLLRKGGTNADAALMRLENTFKNDLRAHMADVLAAAKENREELSQTLNNFRTEVGTSIKLIIEQNQRALETLNQTLEAKITALTEANTAAAREQREALTKSLTDLSAENSKQLIKISEDVQGRLALVSEQTSKDATLQRETLVKAFKDFDESFQRGIKSFNDLQRDKFQVMEEKQNKLVEHTEKKLEQVRETVDEKLQKTLNERLGQSFETVGKQLIEVQKGLGEMQTLAQDVGGLKKVLSNVKMRGGIGEVQLQMLLEQILAPSQFEANVKTKSNSNDLVEFAVKLPGRDENNTQVWLPIDAKFPKDIYEQLQTAYDTGEPAQIEHAQKNLEATIRKMAKDISDKYLDPPNTTDFGIMFLPFEGIYAEVVRKASLLEELQRDFKIIVTGPTTLAAILNSLHMGFRTLIIQKRSSEVWNILGAVKKEFENFSGLLGKAQNNIQTGLDQLDNVIGVRTRAINRKLRGVDALSAEDAKLLLPDVTGPGEDNEEV